MAGMTLQGVSPAHGAELLERVRRHLPGVAVWAHGSRVRGGARLYSDVDLVVFAGPAQAQAIAALREDLEESNLPFVVDVCRWDDLPPTMQEQIRACHAVLVPG